MGPFDLVLCRNVLIYQDQEHRQEIIQAIHKKILPGGHFILGSEARIAGLDHLFEPKIVDKAVIYYLRDQNSKSKSSKLVFGSYC